MNLTILAQLGPSLFDDYGENYNDNHFSICMVQYALHCIVVLHNIHTISDDEFYLVFFNIKTKNTHGKIRFLYYDFIKKNHTH